MNVATLDIIFIVFLVIMLVVGYIRGFVTRLYDVVSTLLVLFLSYLLTNPISSYITFYKYDNDDVVSMMIGQYMNTLIVFIVLLIILFIIKKIIGIFVKPLLKGIMEKFKITSFADKVLGIILSFVEAIVITYLVLVLWIIPFSSEGVQNVEETNIVKYVLDLSPQLSDSIIELRNSFENVSENASSFSLQSLTKMMLASAEVGYLDDEAFLKTFEENVLKGLESETINLSQDQRNEIDDIMDELGYTQSQKDLILSHIKVSE